MSTFNTKIEAATDVIQEAIANFPRLAVACSFGKDSMVVTHLAKTLKPNIHVFSIMTMHKPIITFKYLKKMNKLMNLDVQIFMVARNIPSQLKGLNVHLLPTTNYDYLVKVIGGRNFYYSHPDKCCQLLKVVPTKKALENLDAWITGLRNTEGETRKDFQKIEKGDNLTKYNPILDWTETDIWKYLAINQIPVNPLYGKDYRSLGCSPCSQIIEDDEPERAGRWKNTSKCGGECGIHTQKLK
jgi:phosphoadenosine phosphosulfate reductase